MAIFSGEEGKSKSGVRAGENTLSIVSAGTTISGDVECSGVLKVEGRIEGSVRKARQVMLAKEGAIQGNVTAGEVVVGGVIEGAVTATERLELQHTAVVNGDITTRSIVVMEGARINGGLKMIEIALVTGSDQSSESREPKIARRS